MNGSNFQEPVIVKQFVRQTAEADVIHGLSSTVNLALVMPLPGDIIAFLRFSWIGKNYLLPLIMQDSAINFEWYHNVILRDVEGVIAFAIERFMELSPENRVPFHLN